MKSSPEQVTDNQGYRTLVAVGLAGYGLVHVIIAGLALQLAWSGGGEQASSQGALQEIAKQPLGSVLLWVVAVGLFALVVWQAIEAIYGYRWKDGAQRIRKRLSSAGRAVVYLALGVSAARIASGSGAARAAPRRR